MTDLTDLTIDTLNVDSIVVNAAPGILIGGYPVPTLNSFGDGAHVMQVAMATFDPSADASKRPIGTYGLGVILPVHAIVYGGFYDVNTAFTSAGANAGTVALSLEAANDLVTATAVSNAIFGTIGRKAVVPVSTAASTVKATTAKELTIAVAGQVLLTGKLTVYVTYIVGKASA